GWAADQAAADPDETRARLARLRELIDLLDSAAQARDSLRRAEADAAQKKTQVVEAERAAAAGVGAAEAMQLIEWLRDTRDYLEISPDSEVCPVCEQPVVAEDLRRRIDGRLNAMTSLGELRDKLEAANKAYQNAVAIVDRDRDGMLAAARS